MSILTRDTVLDVKAELRSRVERMLSTGDAAGPLHWWWVPGRVEVFGKHTDYGGGPSLMGALPRGFLLAGAPRADQKIRIFDSGDGSRFELDLSSGRTVPADVTGWRRYANILGRRLHRDFPGASLGADIALASDLPRASGMSSSSALVVGLAHALIRISRIDERDDWKAVFPSSVDRGGYFACLENGLPFGPFAGDGGLGTFGGSEDQTAIVCCRPGHLSQFSYMPVRHIRDVAVPDAWTFVLASSGIAAEKAGRAQALYNRASLGVRALIDLWRAHVGSITSLTEVLSADAEAESRLRAVIDRHASGDWPREVLHIRLTHFAREYPRVSQAANAFAAADAARVGSLAAASHDDADRLLCNQLPETNTLVALALQQGAIGASAFGAGFGGSVWALINSADDAAIKQFGDAWLGAYRAKFPDRTPMSTWFPARPGAPLTDI
jgi:galactokinase